jgi:hypothetical protein
MALPHMRPLVGINFQERLVERDGIAGAFEPSHDGQPGPDVRERWKSYFRHHVFDL